MQCLLLHEEPVKINTRSFELAYRLFFTDNSLPLFLQVRASLFEMVRKTKFDLRLHILVTSFILFFLNILVIFIPTMKDIFGVVGTVSDFVLLIKDCC